MKVDLKKIEQYVASGKVSKRKHPTLPLNIYTYSKLTEFGNDWDEITTMCRGLILDLNGNVIGNPWPKFFNIEQTGGSAHIKKLRSETGYREIEHKGTRYNIPDVGYTAYEKMDGSILYGIMYDNHIVLASKGSFESDQVKVGEKILAEKYPDFFPFDGLTFIWEIIYPANRIVVDYGDMCDLVLLGVRDVNGKDYNPRAFVPFSKAPVYEKTIEELLVEKDRKEFVNKEGFVIHFDNGEKVKIKYEAYFDLHKIMTNVTSKDILEALEKGDSVVSFCEQKEIPDEMLNEIKAVEKEFVKQYAKIEEDCKYFLSVALDKRERKAQAKNVKEFTPSKYQGIVFAMLDEKDYSKMIFTLLKIDEKMNRKFIGKAGAS